MAKGDVEETEFLKVWLLDQQHHLGTYRGNANSHLLLQTSKSETLEVEPSNLCFNELSPGTVRNGTCRLKLIMDQQFLIRVQPNTLRTSVH